MQYVHSFTTSTFQWLAPDAWEPTALMEFFLLHRTRAEAKSLVFAQPWVRQVPSDGQRWLLTDIHRVPYGWAEVRLVPGPFCTAIVLVEVEGPAAMEVAAFSYLLSAMLILHGAHVGEVHVVPGTSEAVIQFLDRMGTGRGIATIPPTGPGALHLSTKYTWSREAWFAIPEGQRSHRELTYLQLRHDREKS